MVGYGVPSAAVADALSQALGRPVSDKTGLTGTYDFQFTWTPGLDEPQNRTENLAAPDPLGPSLFTAVQEQLGLRLTSVTAAVNVLIIDRAEKATEN